MIIQELESATGSKSQPQTHDPMNKFINLEARQSTLESSYKEAREKCVRKIGRFIYVLGLSFNIIQTSYWKEMREEVRLFGIGFKQLSLYEISTRILKAEGENIDEIKATHMMAWKQYGYTMMLDGWTIGTDRKSMSLINFLVNSPEGTFFYKSIDISESIKIGAFLLEQLDKMVAGIGEEHVIQIFTDNHASYMNASVRLMDTRKCLYWFPCVAHCLDRLDLMLEDISKRFTRRPLRQQKL